MRSKTNRAERLCQVLAALAAIWAIVAVFRLWRGPAPLDVAEQAIAEGQWETAVECYLIHLVDHPDDWGARLELSVPLTEIDPKQALVELRKIPPDTDEYLQANRQIAGICIACERFKEAKEALLALEAATPDDWWVHVSLAEAFLREGKLILALHHAQRGAQLNPAHTRTHFLVAEVLDDLNRHVEMIPPLQEVIALEPEHYGAHLNLCYAYAKAGQAGNTRREAEWCLARNPAEVDALRLLATAARDEGKRDEAMEKIQKALKLSPDDLNSRLLEAELLLFDRKADEAFGRLQPLYDRHKNDRRLAALLARSATAAGQLEEAKKYREQVQKLSQ
ncbi:MAG: tetratricopeptide repeat protein [Pirellulaceae bacterium]|nr:tetratricopeptide repeat protein [Pirellulaceae bacterium]